MQHRYYGESIPYGSREEALKNASIRGYFNSVQAIADYAEIILHIKETFNALNSPVIVIGGSYGGSRWLFPALPFIYNITSKKIISFINFLVNTSFISKYLSELLKQMIDLSFKFFKKILSILNYYSQSI